MSAAGPLSSARFARALAAHWLDIGRAVAAATRDADLLLAPMGLLGYHVAEAAGIPSMGAFLQPLEATRAFRPAVLLHRLTGFTRGPSRPEISRLVAGLTSGAGSRPPAG
ncbi:hypothetical protein [Actinoplanes teichomyceticus]|uniref:Uncharacterized protein n=1 Tax=Actinoplanes teichomyceticus TaxID=1867 RepID=A0A561VL38_ACTTI|nr:hypothetical protein [Actinoplanes teichomyceticus]TWG12307.1 hypothetical protein FHX34_105174 [Actinoplanes teichomyceticus]GIF14248.1 hypothetical protein Ate01nite_42800 [Actinoplanes teichomyceticus]